ncbi:MULTISPECIES: hypothetical protein [Mycobacteriaceae]|uniref:Uncharacterized protein n=1 Tax=Mycolicibacterium nivoides TaxID=2487344 RepID=A0ABW9LN96_9MYCO|nr:MULTISPECIES: hypothetical protein [Mycobacteriaceae]
MEESAEDLDLDRLPAVVETYFAQERAWHRLLRGTGLQDETASRAELARWVQQ